MSSNDVEKLEGADKDSPSPDETCEALSEEAGDNALSLVKKVKDQIQALKDGARSGITGQFGKPEIADAGETGSRDRDDKTEVEAKPESKPEPPGVPVDKAAMDEAARQRLKDTALELDLRAESYMPQVVGRGAKELKYEENHRLNKAATPMELAKARLGPKAAPEQLEAYAKTIVQLNSEDKSADLNTTKFEAKQTIKLPGQKADGGIVYKEGESTVTKWADGSNRIDFKDGGGYLERHNHPQKGELTKVRWDPNDPEKNFEHRFELKNITPDVVAPRLVFSETTDAQGHRRIVEINPDTFQTDSLTVVDLEGKAVKFDLATSDKGESQAVGDPSTRLSSDGRIFHVETKDGVTIERFDDGAVVEIKKNDEGKEIGRTIREPDGRVIKLDDFRETEDDKTYTAHRVTITEPNGDVTRLEYESVKGWWRGERLDKESGQAIEKVRLTWDGRLISMPVDNPEKSSVEEFEWGRHDVKNSKPVRYDPNGGKVERELADGSTAVDSFKPGRTDVKLADGSVSGSTIRGKVSYQTAKGEATVINPDGTRIELHKDGKIDSFSAEGTQTTGELSATEKDYLAKHPDIDRRDLAEIHRKFADQPEKLNQFYEQLSRVDQAQNLNEAEKRDLRDNILRHVSAPEELYQGKSGTCNVSVIQRDMAMTDPASYTKFLVDAISTGALTTAKGEKISFDVDNLKLLDSSGRDIASRIFQAAAVQISVWPGEFRNTENGVGQIRGQFRGENHDSPILFPGLRMEEIAWAQTTIQGQNAAVVRIDDANDLIAAYEASGGEPFIVAINPEAPPFDDDEQPGLETPHVVTITKIEEGPPVKVYVQNQYGLEDDHSTPATAVDAEAVIKNMQDRKRDDGTKYGEAIVNGKAIKYPKADRHEIKRKTDGTVEVVAYFEVGDTAEGTARVI